MTSWCGRTSILLFAALMVAAALPRPPLQVRFITTVLSISLPISCGLFVPLFCLGAAAGRFFGEVMHLMLPNASLSPAGVYAVIGAAALTSGATQTVSTAVIVMEITGQTSYLMPVLLGTLVAYSVSGIWTVSLYDMLLSLGELRCDATVSATVCRRCAYFERAVIFHSRVDLPAILRGHIFCFVVCSGPDVPAARLLLLHLRPVCRGHHAQQQRRGHGLPQPVEYA